MSLSEDEGQHVQSILAKIKSMPIEQITMSGRLHNILHFAGVKTFKEVLTDWEIILLQRGFGMVCALELLNIVYHSGFRIIEGYYDKK